MLTGGMAAIHPRLQQEEVHKWQALNNIAVNGRRNSQPSPRTSAVLGSNGSGSTDGGGTTAAVTAATAADKQQPLQQPVQPEQQKLAAEQPEQPSPSNATP